MSHHTLITLVMFWCYFRLVLIEEKEQLLRELRSLNLKHRSKEDVTYIQKRIQELEQDLQREIDEANRQMAVKNIRSINY